MRHVADGNVVRAGDVAHGDLLRGFNSVSLSKKWCRGAPATVLPASQGQLWKPVNIALSNLTHFITFSTAPYRPYSLITLAFSSRRVAIVCRRAKCF